MYSLNRSRAAMTAMAAVLWLGSGTAQADADGGASSHPLEVPVANIANNDERGATSNVVKDFYVSPGATIVSLKWDVQLTSNAGSYLSEMQLTFSDTLGNGVTFTPGHGDDFDGTATYSGVQDLSPLGRTVVLGADGVLRLEFHDAYKDLAFDEPEGMWNSGTLTFGVSPVPEPASCALMLGGLVLLNAVRRRLHQGNRCCAMFIN